MKTLISLLALSVLSTTACVSGTLSDTVGASETLNFNIPEAKGIGFVACSGQTTFTTIQSTTIDISNALQELEKQGSLTVNFTDNSLAGNLSSFKHADIYIGNPSDQPQLLSQTDFVPTNGKVELPIILDHGTLFQILSAGQAQVIVSLSTCGVPTDAQSITYDLSASIDLSFSKP